MWHNLDPELEERLLSGALHPDDAPPELRHLARVVRAARPQAVSGSPVEQSVVSAFVANAPGVAGQVQLVGRKRMLTKFMTVKAASLAAGLLLVGGGAAAAATGSLPASVQSGLSGGLSHVGISIPNPHASEQGKAHAADHGSTGAGNGSTGANHGSAAADNSQAGSADLYGQCTAWTAVTKAMANNPTAAGHSQADFPKLAAAAKAGNESIAQLCATVSRPSEGSTTTTTSTTSPTGTEPTHSAGPPTSVPEGPPVSVPEGPPSSLPGNAGSHAPDSTTHDNSGDHGSAGSTTTTSASRSGRGDGSTSSNTAGGAGR